MLYREIIAVCSEIHTRDINTLCGQNTEFVNVTAGGTYSDQWALEGLVSVINAVR
jgi:cysteine sulfinate desulfinase/cysteine desulfurase-like protein